MSCQPWPLVSANAIITTCGIRVHDPDPGNGEMGAGETGHWSAEEGAIHTILFCTHFVIGVSETREPDSGGQSRLV